MEYSLKLIGKTIAQARKSKGWSQDRLIEELSMLGVAIGRNRLSAIEQGKETKEPIGVDFLLAICKLLDMDIGHLFGEYREKTREVYEISAFTGLSEASINTLHQLATLPDKPGFRGVFVDGKQIQELSLLDDLITAKRFHPLFNAISMYLIYGLSFPQWRRPELSSEEYSKMKKWLDDCGLAITPKQEVCDMYLQNACDELKAIYKDVLAKGIGGNNG